MLLGSGSSSGAGLLPERAFCASPHPVFRWSGVLLRQARGRGVNLAMAAYAYLELVRRGATHLSYTLVLDDNWPSRRTGERLGGYVCANYMVYRRNLARR